MEDYNIGYFVGSLSQSSINRRLANTLIALAPDNLRFTEITWGDYPVYNRDFDKDFPKNYPQVCLRGKEQVRRQDAFLIVTPEYNRGIPGPLKNAIDALSRPYGDNPFTGKPLAVAGASIGVIGTAIAQAHWRTTFGLFNMPQMGQPEVYIKLEENLEAGDGVITDEKIRSVLQQFIDAYAGFVAEYCGKTDLSAALKK